MTNYIFPLKDRKEVAEGTMAFFFDTSRAPDFTFEAGQNADYTLDNPPHTDAEGNTRTFSFASSPTHRDYIMITTRMRDTAFKNSLKEIPLGTPVRVFGPSGNMILHENASRPAVFLAGGIGITPFRSMIEYVTLQQLPHHMTLFYSNRTPASTAFISDFEQWAKDNPRFSFVPTISDASDASWKYEQGMIDRAMLERHLKDLTAPVYYIAGPPAMVTSLRTMLLENGVSKDDIRLESFTGY